MDTTVTNTTAPIVGAETTQLAQQPTVNQTTEQADKAARFKDRAENQASKVMAEIEKLQKLSNKKYYTYSNEQITEMFNAMQKVLDEVKEHFLSDAVEKEKRFTFSA